MSTRRGSRARGDGLTVAVTGATGTFAQGLIPLLEADDRVGRIVGIARHPFSPADHGWPSMEFRQGDVRDRDALEAAFAGADVVVHLAFLITGASSPETARAINVDGTANAFAAAAAAGATRFVYSSSAAAYGFHPDNPVPMTEDWPVRPDHRFFYAAEKAEVEELLAAAAAEHPEVGLYLIRPPIVLGPHAVGAKSPLPDRLRPAFAALSHGLARLAALPVGVPVVVPALPMQFVHEDDVGDALLRCVVGEGPPGAYNIAGDGVVTAHDVARELGLRPVPFPVGPTQWVARAVAGLPLPPWLPPVTGWVDALSHPSIVDCARARRDLGWRPRYSSMEALRSVTGA